jgi:ribosomal protein S18 acetylase RimI-like enzyme
LIDTHDLKDIDLFLDACRRHYLGRPAEPGEARNHTTRPGTDPARDIAVVRDDSGAVIGFGSVWLAGAEARCFARVHPDARGRGIGGALLATMEARAHELVPTSRKSEMTVTSWATDEAGPALLRSRGFIEARFFLRMQCDLIRSSILAADPPAGVTIRQYDPGRDTDRIFPAWQEAFAAHWGQGEVLAAEWWHDRPSPEAGPRRWLVADDGQQIVGLCLAAAGEDSPDVGYVGDIGVLPGWRAGTGHRAPLPDARDLQGGQTVNGSARHRRREHDGSAPALPQGRHAARAELYDLEQTPRLETRITHGSWHRASIRPMPGMRSPVDRRRG